LPRKQFCRTEKKPTVRQTVTTQKQHFKTATFLHFHAAGNTRKSIYISTIAHVLFSRGNTLPDGEKNGRSL
jgi:hypothetical protein